MAEEKEKTTLTKFPNAEKANKEAPGDAGLPGAFDLFKPSVRVIQNNLPAFLVLLAIPMVLLFIGQGPSLFKPTADSSLMPEGPFGAFLFLGYLATLLATPGVILLQIRGTHRETLSWQEAFSKGLNHVLRLLGLGILIALALTASFLLFIIPFFFVLPRLFMSPYYLIDRKMGIIESMKTSWHDYKTYKGIWGIIGVSILLGLASIVPFIGWIITAVLTFLYSAAAAIRYEQIKNLAADKPARTPIEVDESL